MDADALRRLLAGVRDGSVEVADAERTLRRPPIDQTAFATLDRHRQLRCGFPEVVYAPGKTTAQLVEIVARQHEAGIDCLATRVSEGQRSALGERFDRVELDETARTAWLAASDAVVAKVGRVAVVTAGTADLPVAAEARVTADAMGCETRLIVDVGVAGLHRLLGRLDDLLDADCVVVVAGMEGALPSVVGGLVAAPVIAVPTSVGYGANLHGITALLGMLTSCAANVGVVNVDAGFNGGYLAALIARRSR